MENIILRPRDRKILRCLDENFLTLDEIVTKGKKRHLDLCSGTYRNILIKLERYGYVEKNSEKQIRDSNGRIMKLKWRLKGYHIHEPTFG